MYHYHTGLGWWVPPADEDELLNTTYGGDPYAGDPGYAGGMPVLWESWWDVGIVALGSARPVEYMVGVVSGAPGWATAGEEENSGKSYIARVGLTPIPALRVGVSGSHGPYVNDVGAFRVPPGKSVNDYDQERFSKIVGSDGVPRPWHPDVDRVESGLGYRINRALLAKTVWQRFTKRGAVPGQDDDVDDLFAANLVVSF
jgi:hypothetical protein